MKSLLLLALAAASALPSQGSAQRCDDDELAEVAALLLLARRDAPPASAEITQALHSVGSSLPSARVLVVREDDSAPGRVDQWLTRLDRESDGPVVCGEAQGSVRVVVHGVRAGSLRRDGELMVARWAERFHDPYLVVVREAGQTSAFAVPASGRVEIPDDIRRAQLVATGPQGPRPLADWGSLDLPPLPQAPTDVQRLERLRDQAGVSPLRDNRLLTRAANAHAQTVCREHRARHVFDTWPADRMRRLGLRARHLGEAVARAANVGAALEALAQSPSHRMALVDRRFTDVGFGVVRSGGESCVVVFLAAWPQAVAF